MTTTTNTVDLTATTINVAEVVERIEELETPPRTPEHARLVDLLDDLLGRGVTLRWRRGRYPLLLIRADYFPTYAREMLSAMGQLPRKLAPEVVIDWKATAANILSEHEYESLDVDGVKYWFRGLK